MLILGFIYSLMVNANINASDTTSSTNPFFRSPLLNRLFWNHAVGRLLFFADLLRRRPHATSQRERRSADENGATVDWISIYKHGMTAKPKSVGLRVSQFLSAMMLERFGKNCASAVVAS